MKTCSVSVIGCGDGAAAVVIALLVRIIHHPRSRHLVYIRKSSAAGFDGIQSLADLRNNWNRLLKPG